MSWANPDTHGDIWQQRQPGSSSNRARWIATCDHCPAKLDDSSVIYGSDALDWLTRHVKTKHGFDVPPTGDPAWTTPPHRKAPAA